MTPILLQLFIAGRTPRTDQAIATLRQLVDHQLSGYQCQLVIVDVLTDPQQAEDRRILATPTLIKESPLPQRRIIGDLADADGLLAALSLPPLLAPKRDSGGDEGLGGHWLDDRLARI